MIVCGIILSRKSGWGGEFWSGLEKLVYYWLFPALLFRSIVRQSVSLDRAGPLACGVLSIVLIATLTAWAAQPLLKPNPVRFASIMQCAMRFNSYVLLSLSQRIGGAEVTAMAAVCVGIAVSPCNALAVTFLARHGTTGVLRELVRNPLIVATVAAGVFNVLGVHLPEPVDSVLERAGNASMALGLICVGAGVRFDGAQNDKWLMCWITAVKLLLLPAAALLIAPLFHLDATSRTALLIFAAVPTASSCYILANRMGGDGRYVAMAVSVSTVTAIATLPLWLRASGLG